MTNDDDDDDDEDDDNVTSAVEITESLEFRQRWWCVGQFSADMPGTGQQRRHSELERTPIRELQFAFSSVQFVCCVMHLTGESGTGQQ